MQHAWRYQDPDRNELMLMYCRQRLGLTAIAKRYGASTTWVKRWIGRYGLVRSRAVPAEARVVKAENGCMEWTGAIDSKGYGLAWVDGRHMKAHRLFWERYTGKSVPRGMVLDHLCRNRRCVNPDHLEAVTNAVNTQRGSRAKLDASAVRNIRRLAKHWNYDTLAFLAGVHPETIGGIVRRRAWSNV